MGWSLNFEIFFYIIFGISLVFKTNRYFFIVAFFIATYISGLIFQPENAYLKIITSNLNLYFVVGILFSLLLTKFTIPKKYAFLICFLGISTFAIHLFNIIVINDHLFILLTFSLLVLSILLFDFTFKWSGNKFFIYLGDIPIHFIYLILLLKYFSADLQWKVFWTFLISFWKLRLLLELLHCSIIILKRKWPII